VSLRPSCPRQARRRSIEERQRLLFSEGSPFLPVDRTEIVGIDGVLDAVAELVHWLRHAREYAAYGARLEPGVLLEGPPGTGKTLVTRYLATASEALFVSVHDFPVTASTPQPGDIAELFARARRAYATTGRPVVLFWDEFETAGANRMRPGASPAQAAAVAQLATELDGVGGKNEGVLLVVATNHAAALDAALLRPGRLGKRIHFAAPDRHGKALLLDHYLATMSVGDDVDADALSHLFVSGTSAAAIEETVRDAWRVAVRDALAEGKAPVLGQAQLVESLLDRLLGAQPPYGSRADDALLRTAVHEVGHALAALSFGVPVRLVSVRAGKGFGGRTITGEPSRASGTVAEQQAHLRVGFGGMVAEQIAGVGEGTGNGSDTATNTRRALMLVEQNGLGRAGAFNPMGAVAPPIQRALSEELLADLDRGAVELLSDAHADTERALAEIGHGPILELARLLVEHETLLGPQFEQAAKEVAGR
jgi:cell division protease FtsH